MSGMDKDYLQQAREIGAQLTDSGVEYGGEVPESELGTLETPDTSDPHGAESDDLHSAEDGDYLAEARGAGGDLKEAGVEHVGGADESDLGTMTPPETPEPPTPEAPDNQ
ncbi:hypothetical protein [Mangrovihabitans endophyticus]|uniref:Uncharacterized protein n=1 Tax=Mangrovihabitans endophyticus TaxID=1751298 RepID=A0A8J3C561_9ACTN|nr:hypothetical protein [Mangrovihabitans endophyticus]GGL20134.1 hypothetical protein GCM10012284_63440 [Mangrovihabitans endophyticus]